jgi:hypothetical protein
MFLRLERVCLEADLEGSNPREETFKLKEERQMKTRKSIPRTGPGCSNDCSYWHILWHDL